MIRKAKVSDIKDLNILLKELFSQEKEFIYNKKLHSYALKKIITDKKIGKIFIYKDKDRVVGMLSLLFGISTALGKKVALLEDMIVLKECRESRVGSKLIEFALKYAKRKKIKRITLLSDADNYIAHKFYKKFDFKKSTMVVFRRVV